MQEYNLKKSIRQLQFEHEDLAWERGLEFFRQESIFLKFRLSEMVDNIEEKNFLQMAEYFQNELLMKDEMINGLKKCMQELSLNLSNGNGNGKQARFREINSKRKGLRNNILQFEKNFLILAKNFNERLLRNI